MRVLLDLGADPNLKTYMIFAGVTTYGATALMAAAVEGNIPIMRLLLAHGADPNVQNVDTPMDGPYQALGHDAATALALAAGIPDAVRVLLQAGAKPDIAERDGSTALLWAAADGEGQSIRLLLQAGADRCRANKGGTTADAIARDFGHPLLADYLERLEALCPDVDMHESVDPPAP